MPRKPPRRTRERILATALMLFNDAGEPHVTTAHIADEMNISPGNLYYHFRNKDDIIGELYAALETSVRPLLAPLDDRTPTIEDLWLFLHLLFERMGEYRFFNRDLDEITSRNRRIAARFAALTREGEGAVRALCDGLVAAGAMQASAQERAALARNIALVATYWMSFQRIGQGATAAHAHSALDPGAAAYQVLSLIAPYLVGDARAHVVRLSHEYL